MLYYVTLRWYEFQNNILFYYSAMFYNDGVCNKVNFLRESNNGYI